MARVKREKQYNVRMNSDDIRQFRLVSNHYNLSIVSTIRMLVKKEFDAIVAEQKARAGR